MKNHKNFPEGTPLQHNKTLLVALIVLISIFFIVLFTACSKDDGDTATDRAASFAEVIAVGNEFEPIPESRKTDTLAVSEPTNKDYELEENGSIVKQRFVCTTKTLSVLDGNGQFPLFNTNADVIYPGSLLQGKTLSNATPSPIVVERAGGTISYDLNNGNLQSTFSVDKVKKSSVQDGMNNIISTAGDVVPANFQLDIIQVESQSQLALEMGLSAEGYGARVEADMSFSTEKEYNRTLVKLSQSYYTMSFDLPTSLDQIFDESVTPEQLSTYVQADNPATFISSVTYGRIFYMLVESTSSRQQMSASLNLAYDGFGASAEGSLEVSAFNSLNDLKIKVIAYGGDAAGAIDLAGETSVSAIATRLAESTDIKAGLPLSYVVRSVERPDQIVGTKLATEYDVVECELKGILPTANYLPLVDLFDDGIGAATQVAGSTVLIYNKAGDRYAYYNVSNATVLGIFDIDDPNGPMGATDLGEVGAAVRSYDTVITLFDGSGIRIQDFIYEPPAGLANQASLPDSPIVTKQLDIFPVADRYGSVDPFPFAGDGIDAVFRLDAAVLVTNVSLVLPRYTCFSTDGGEYAHYFHAIGRWYGVQSSNTFSNHGQPGKLFERVGAAARVEFGFTGNTVQVIFFNEAGDQMMTWDESSREFDGPWVIN